MTIEQKRARLLELQKQIKKIQSPAFLGSVGDSIELFKEAVSLTIELVTEEEKKNVKD